MKREGQAAKDEITRARAVARLLELSEQSQGKLGEKTWTREELHERHPKETETTSESDLAEQGMDQWSRGLPEEDAESLVDSSAGKSVRWVPGEGWIEDSA